CQRYSNSLFTF
nr:immunoglobulin light chain junction region [Macaca mulatta]